MGGMNQQNQGSKLVCGNTAGLDGQNRRADWGEVGVGVGEVNKKVGHS